MNIPDQINQFIELLVARVYPFATAMAAVGVLSMATIQTLKELLPLRRIYQKHFVLRWLAERARKAIPSADPGRSAEAAEAELITLSTAGDRRAFYELPIEQLTGQMAAAAQVVLDYPGRYGDLFNCLAATGDPDDRSRFVDAPPYAHTDRRQLSPEQQEQVTRHVDRRTRLTHHVQRAIDALQIAAGSQWKHRLQVMAFVLSALFTFSALAFFRGLSFTRHELGAALATGLAGGFVAPIARDLVASLEQLRRK